MSVDQSSVIVPAPSIWQRGLFMLVVLFLFGVGQSLLCAAALVQFFWMLFSGKRNDPLAEFGSGLGLWLAKAARFLTAASDEKPFPWTPWAQSTPPAS